MIVFRNYEVSLLDDQVVLVEDVIKDWNWVIWYPNKETLRRNYSQEGFTPETRHYAYDGDKLVGFLSSSVDGESDGILWGSIHLPFIRKGYEFIEEELLKRTLNLLKNKGVKAIRAIAMPGWGSQIDILERWGFGDQELLSQVTIFPTSILFDSSYSKPDYLQEIFLDQNMELLIEAISVIYSVPKENYPKYFDNVLTPREFIAAAVIDTDDYILFGILNKGCDYIDIPGRLFFTMELKTKNEREIELGPVIKEAFKFFSNKAQERGFKFMWYQMTNLNQFNYYKSLNLKFEPCYRYILRII